MHSIGILGILYTGFVDQKSWDLLRESHAYQNQIRESASTQLAWIAGGERQKPLLLAISPVNACIMVANPACLTILLPMG